MSPPGGSIPPDRGLALLSNGTAEFGSGASVAGTGDVNGDGFNDFIISSPERFDAGGASYGVGGAYVVYGDSNGFDPAFDLSQLDGANGFAISALDDESRYSRMSVAGLGDVNGDGFNDVLVTDSRSGLPFTGYAGPDKAAASFVVFGAATAPGALVDLNSLTASQGFRLPGPASAYSGFGEYASAAGDFNGDGIDDFLLSGDDTAPYGAVHIIFGTVGGFPPDFDVATLNGANGFTFTGSVTTGQIGDAFGPAGDVNGDGVDDLIFGAPQAGAAGGAFIVFGVNRTFAPTFDLSTLGPSDGVIVTSSATNGALGTSVSAAGDVNGDGVDDVLLGDRAFNNGPGAAFVIFGDDVALPATLDAATLTAAQGYRLDGDPAFDDTGIDVSSAGDLNGDGVDDFLVAAADRANFNDPPESAIYVIYGGAAPPAATSLDALTFDQGFRLRMPEINGADSAEFASVGDVNGDGLDDLLVSGGREYNFPVNEPAVLIFGSTDLGGVNDAPLAADDMLTIRGADPVDLTRDNGAGPDFDPDISDLTIVQIDGLPVMIGDTVTLASGVLLKLVSETEVSFTAPDLRLGDNVFDTFTYVVSDGALNSAPATVTVDFSETERLLSPQEPIGGFAITDNDNVTALGLSVDIAGDINGDGIDDLIVGGVYDTYSSYYGDLAGEAYVIFGDPNGFPADVDVDLLSGADGFQINPTSSSYSTEITVSAAGDVNGDGIDDLAVTSGYAYYYDDGIGFDVYASNAYVIFGTTGGFPGEILVDDLNGADGFQITGTSIVDNFQDISDAGDVNGDGFGDLIVGDGGSAKVLFGSSTPAPSVNLDLLSGADGFAITGDAYYTTARNVAGIGDVNGDGFDDVAVSAGGIGALVVFGSDAGFASEINSSQLNGANGFAFSTAGGPYSSGTIDIHIDGVGDFNGDGIDDFIVGDYYAYDPSVGAPGAAYIVFGSDQPFAPTISASGLSGADGFRIVGDDFFSLFGASVAGAGDVNGDGLNDVAITARTIGSEGPGASGEAFVLYGSTTTPAATVSVSSINGLNGFHVPPANAYDGFGVSVAGGGDVNGDGLDDLLFGAPLGGYYSGYDGTTYVLFGGDTVVNTPPTATPDAATTNEETPVSIDVLANDVDPDPAPLIITAIDGVPLTAGEIRDLASGAQVAITPGGMVAYDPNGAFEGLGEAEFANDTFTYTIEDDFGETSDADVVITITGVNDAPVAAPDIATTDEDSDVVIDAFANDLDIDGPALAVSAIDGVAIDPGQRRLLPSGAELLIGDDGFITYATRGAFEALAVGGTAADAFSYTVTDGAGGLSTADVNVTITGMNDAPVAAPDTATTDEDSVVVIDAFANDLDIDGPALAISAIDGVAIDPGQRRLLPSGAELLIGDDGFITYATNAAFDALAVGGTAADAFSYTVADGAGGFSTADVNVTITGVNDAPVARDDFIETAEDLAVGGNLIGAGFGGEDTDIDGDALAVVAVNGDAAAVGAEITLPSGATLTVRADGGFTYDPAGAFDGLTLDEIATDSFTYEISDGNGGASTATAAVAVSGVDTDPVSNPVNLIEGTPDCDVLIGTDGIDLILGNGCDDFMSGRAGNDTLKGATGRDVIRGGRDADELLGQNGNDRLFGEGGNDLLFGGDGDDLVLGMRGNDRAFGGLGDDNIGGGRGDDTLVGGGGSDRLRGGGGEDSLSGNGGADRLQGGADADRLVGGDGRDTVAGGGGDDTVLGGAGADRVAGRRGDDLLTGGAGADRFLFNAGDGDDTVTDFTQGEDLIRIGRGAAGLDDLVLSAADGAAIVAFANVTIRVEGLDPDDLIAGDFLF